MLFTELISFNRTSASNTKKICWKPVDQRASARYVTKFLFLRAADVTWPHTQPQLREAPQGRRYWYRYPPVGRNENCYLSWNPICRWTISFNVNSAFGQKESLSINRTSLTGGHSKLFAEIKKNINLPAVSGGVATCGGQETAPPRWRWCRRSQAPGTCNRRIKRKDSACAPRPRSFVTLPNRQLLIMI